MILSFGSVNLDLIATVERLPRAGETVLGPGDRALPGGKGANQALAARRAGAEVQFVGCVGRDAFAEPALAELAAAGVGLDHLVRHEAAPTGCALICVDPRGENQIAVALGANAELKAAHVPDALLVPGTLLLLQREVAAGESWALARRAAGRGAKVLLNLAPAGEVPADVLRTLDWLILNEGEAAELARAQGVVADAAALAKALGIGVVTTLGADGIAACRGAEHWRVPALPVTPVDTTGAGDAAVGAFSAALDCGLRAAEALRWASVAGALACITPGAQSSLPALRQIQDALPRLPAAGAT
jgi:ribokinase